MSGRRGRASAGREAGADADAAHSLTIGGARLLGQEGEIGVIKEGAWADMLLLEDGDAVLRNPALLAEPGAIRAVFQGGRCVRSEDSPIPLPIDPTRAV